MGPMRVLMTIPTTGTDGNDRLAGVFRYLAEHGPWELRMPSTHLAFSADELSAMLAEGLDGVLTSARFDAASARLLTKARIPVVVLHDSYMHRREVGPNFRFALSDHVEIGRMAARHFLSLGQFAGYACLLDTERNRWGRARSLGFSRVLGRAGFAASVYTPAANPFRIIDRARFLKWIRRQPRPLALFATNDRLAAQAVAYCREEGLSVPKDVAVLGVDGDRTFSAVANLALSTIEPDFPSAGYAAAEMLDRLMSGDPHVPRVRLFKPRRLIERDTTRPLPPAVRLVENALALIDANGAAPLTVEAVAQRLHVSRPLLDLRFRELGRGTVAAAIRRRRLDEVKRLLATTDYTIRRIGALCDFDSEFALKNLFRRTFGQSMSDYRSSARRR